jgi:molecular chaperone DnaK
VPQIEVTFDIDANGIVNVSAKDKATGKEQSIQITASSGLSKEEIEKLVKDAEMHVDEDRKKRELVEARNHADQLIYSTEKSIKDLGDKVDKATKTKVEDAIGELRKVMDGDDTEKIRRASEELTTASHKLAEAMYQQASQAEGQKAGAQQQAGAGAGGARAAKPEDDVVDADFEEVKDSKK